MFKYILLLLLLSFMSNKTLPKLKVTVPTLPPLQSKVLPRLPALIAYIGPCGSGKSHLALSMALKMRNEMTADGPCVTRVFLYCPTVRSNPIYTALLRPSDKVYEDISRPFAILKEIEAEVEADARIYQDQLRIHVAYKRYVSGEPISMADENLLEQHNWQDVKPIRCHPLLILDDLQGTDLYSLKKANPLVSLCLRHRHLGQGTGLSIMCLTQSHKAMPKPLRNSLSYLAAFRTGNIKERQSFYDESSQQHDFDTFNKAFEKFTEKRYSYCWIDNTNMTVSGSF
jgi:hypothetical protein